jgi:hypothetical protein
VREAFSDKPFKQGSIEIVTVSTVDGKFIAVTLGSQLLMISDKNQLFCVLTYSSKYMSFEYLTCFFDQNDTRRSRLYGPSKSSSSIGGASNNSLASNDIHVSFGKDAVYFSLVLVEILPKAGNL